MQADHGEKIFDVVGKQLQRTSVNSRAGRRRQHDLDDLRYIHRGRSHAQAAAHRREEGQIGVASIADILTD